MSTLSGAVRLSLVEIDEGSAPPSPCLLAMGRRAEDGGDTVSFHRLASGAGVASPLSELEGAARIVIAASGPLRGAAERLRGSLQSANHPAQIELFDPFSMPPAEEPFALPGYHLSRGKTAAHAEVDALPRADSVHPFVLASRPNAQSNRWLERLDAAAVSLAHSPEPTLHLNDERIPLTMDRLRGAAELVRRGLRESKSLCRLHLRAWPADLLCDSRLLDHLTLLPVAALDVLVGSFVPSSRQRMGLAPDDGSEALRRLSTAGLAHLSVVSIAVALPGESPDDAIEGMRRAIDEAVSARIRSIRFSLWLGGTEAPRDSAEQDRLFSQSHPDWHPLACRGLFDFVSLMQSAMPQLSLKGPGFVPGWEAADPEEAVA